MVKMIRTVMVELILFQRHICDDSLYPGIGVDTVHLLFVYYIRIFYYYFNICPSALLYPEYSMVHALKVRRLFC